MTKSCCCCCCRLSVCLSFVLQYVTTRYLAMFVAFTYFAVCVCVSVAAPNKR